MEQPRHEMMVFERYVKLEAFEQLLQQTFEKQKLPKGSTRNQLDSGTLVTECPSTCDIPGGILDEI